MYISKTATLSSCQQYRYSLERIWETSDHLLLVVGLNPSTADADEDDPTIRRCVGFAKRLGFSGLLVANLFAARSTSPLGLKNFADPIGADNDLWLTRLQSRAARIVVAWGNGGSLGSRSGEVLKLLRDPYCFGKTQSGHPRHPLYLRGTSPIERY